MSDMSTCAFGMAASCRFLCGSDSWCGIMAFRQVYYLQECHNVGQHNGLMPAITRPLHELLGMKHGADVEPLPWSMSARGRHAWINKMIVCINNGWF